MSKRKGISRDKSHAEGAVNDIENPTDLIKLGISYKKNQTYLYGDVGVLGLRLGFEGQGEIGQRKRSTEQRAMPSYSICSPFRPLLPLTF